MAGNTALSKQVAETAAVLGVCVEVRRRGCAGRVSLIYDTTGQDTSHETVFYHPETVWYVEVEAQTITVLRALTASKFTACADYLILSIPQQMSLLSDT